MYDENGNWSRKSSLYIIGIFSSAASYFRLSHSLVLHSRFSLIRNVWFKPTDFAKEYVYRDIHAKQVDWFERRKEQSREQGVCQTLNATTTIRQLMCWSIVAATKCREPCNFVFSLSKRWKPLNVATSDRKQFGHFKRQPLCLKWLRLRKFRD